jgi:hypothetical protein
LARHTLPQIPAAHTAVLFAGVGHAIPQAPQWVGDEVSSTHELLHCVCPAGQVEMQRPAIASQLGVGVEQRSPQRAQWVAVPRGASQPLPHAPSQLPKPGAQLFSQVPATQLVVALAGATHRVPHAPQFAGSRFGSTHWPLHGVIPTGQVAALSAAASLPGARASTTSGALERSSICASGRGATLESACASSGAALSTRVVSAAASRSRIGTDVQAARDTAQSPRLNRNNDGDIDP